MCNLSICSIDLQVSDNTTHIVLFTNECFSSLYIYGSLSLIHSCSLDPLRQNTPDLNAGLAAASQSPGSNNNNNNHNIRATRKRSSMTDEDYDRATTFGDEHDTMPLRMGKARRCVICMNKVAHECTNEKCQARIKSFIAGAEMYGTPLCSPYSGARTTIPRYGPNNTKTCLELHMEQKTHGPAAGASWGIKRESL